MKNPWLQIPVEDYEGHMSHPGVMQLQMLDEIFREVLKEFKPDSIAVLGSTAGNGFQHLLGQNFNRVVGIDINFKYLAECKAWFIQDIQNLQLICADLNELEFVDDTFDLIHAALIFEYVEIKNVLSKISRWLKPGGILTVVLQQHKEDTGKISETPYASIKLLKNFIKIVDEKKFLKTAFTNKFMELKKYTVLPENNKNFSVIYLKKQKAG